MIECKAFGHHWRKIEEVEHLSVVTVTHRCTVCDTIRVTEKHRDSERVIGRRYIIEAEEAT